MTYEEKKRWLWRYQEALRAEEELAQELEQLKEEATRVTPLLSDAPGGGGSADKLPKAVERIVEAQQRLQCQINCAQAARKEVVAAIETVHSSRDRDILRRRYLLGQRWEEIACAVCVDFSWLMRMHKRIVLKIPIETKNTH